MCIIELFWLIFYIVKYFHGADKLWWGQSDRWTMNLGILFYPNPELHPWSTKVIFKKSSENLEGGWPNQLTGHHYESAIPPLVRHFCPQDTKSCLNISIMIYIATFPTQAVYCLRHLYALNSERAKFSQKFMFFTFFRFAPPAVWSSRRVIYYIINQLFVKLSRRHLFAQQNTHLATDLGDTTRFASVDSASATVPR